MTPVVADADVLFGATTRGLLIHLDFIALIRLHWSPLILDALSRALVDTDPGDDSTETRQVHTPDGVASEGLVHRQEPS